MHVAESVQTFLDALVKYGITVADQPDEERPQPTWWGEAPRISAEEVYGYCLSKVRAQVWCDQQHAMDTLHSLFQLSKCSCTPICWNSKGFASECNCSRHHLWDCFQQIQRNLSIYQRSSVKAEAPIPLYKSSQMGYVWVSDDQNFPVSMDQTQYHAKAVVPGSALVIHSNRLRPPEPAVK